jgi:hypothetical protein
MSGLAQVFTRTDRLDEAHSSTSARCRSTRRIGPRTIPRPG